MHDGTTEDGTLRTCWECHVEHYSVEEPAWRDRDWRDLCEHCMTEYYEGKALGVQAVKEGRSDFERRYLHGVKRLGYMAGRFMASTTRKKEDS